ncbi:glycosyltransferase [bacterium]|nr:glycosyltransferase [bacterium]
MNVGGTARYIGRLAEALPNQGIDTALVIGHVQGSEVEDPIVETLSFHRIEHLGRRINPLEDLRARHELRAVIRSYDPDLVHTHTFKAGALIRSLNLDIPLVHTFHGHLFDDPDFVGRKATVIEFIERQLAPRTTRIVTVGEVVGQDLLKRGIGKPGQFLSIPPGVDALDLPSRHDARQQLRLPEDSLVVAWVARVTEVKGPQRVLALAESFPDTTFLMAGGGNLLADMQHQAPSNLHVLGWMPTALVYAACDIALSTSFNEGMPVSLIEAQLAGLPVVANDVGSVREVVQHEVTGFVGENSDLKGNLETMLQNNSLRERMGLVAQQRARQTFSPQRMVNTHSALYREILQA